VVAMVTSRTRQTSTPVGEADVLNRWVGLERLKQNICV
jgi:hypothetical protein